MIPESAIRLRSYLIWQQAGCPDGKAVEHWLRAKAELEAENRAPRARAGEREPYVPYVVARPPISRRPQKLPCRRIASGECEAPVIAARQ